MGESGYFYVSYYDTVLGRTSYAATFESAQSAANYDTVYQYDPLGDVNDFGGNDGSTTLWGANRFTAGATSILKAVGFYVEAPNTAYEVWEGPSTASLTKITQGTLPQMGFHTVTLPTGPALTSGVAFVVAVKLTTPGHDYPLAIEYPVAGYSSAATASPGQSYFSSDGTTWTDLTTVKDNANVCLKAYTITATAVAPTLTAPNGGESWTLGSAHDITWSTGNGGAVTIELSRDDGSSWETLFASTANDGSASWTVGGAVTSQALVRVSNSSGSDTSNAAFTVEGTTVTAPALGVPVSPRSVGQGKTFTVSGTLKPQFPAGEKTVKIKLYRLVRGVWKYVRTYDAVNAEYSNYSKYKLKISLTRRARYHFKAYTRANDEWTAAVSKYSRTMTVKRVASVSAPRVPTTARAGRTFTVWGYLRPRFGAGQKTVKVRLYRYRSGKWTYVRSYFAVNSNYSSYSKYKARIRLTAKALYHFRAFTSATSTWAGTHSRYSRTMRVR